MIAKDKKLHALVGFGVGALVSAATGGYVAWGILASLVVAWGKEFYDRKTPGRTYDPYDAHWTFGGGIFGSVALGMW